MKISKINRFIFIAILTTPSISYEICNDLLLKNWLATVLCILAFICLLITFGVVFMQLFFSFEWLYTKGSFMSSLKPLYLIYKDPDNVSFSPSYKERVVHILLGFFLYLTLFTNIYQCLSLESIDSFNIKQSLNFIDSFYFTTATSATVGFGDISPQTGFARFIVTIQVLTTFLYVIGILSSLPSILGKLDEKHD
jgi:hypothetical protein